MAGNGSTLVERPGLVAEMAELRRSGDNDLRQAAEGVLSGLSADDRMLDALISPDLDRWARLAACEELLGAGTEARCRAVAADRNADADLRAGARDALESIRLRGSHVQAAAAAPGPDRSRDVQAARGAPATDTSTLVEAADRPASAAEPPKPRKRFFWEKR
ncbi:MAG: hypothetical protein NT029_07930 [Armatimonadetes bacterium]|nr:hypothetical protein [Armatimonadota bacterium]